MLLIQILFLFLLNLFCSSKITKEWNDKTIIEYRENTDKIKIDLEFLN